MRLTCLGPREAHRLGQGPLPSGSRGLQVQVCRPPVGVGGHRGGLGDWMTPRPGSSPGGFTVGGSAGNFQVLLTPLPPPRKEPDPSPCCPQLPRACSVCPSVHLGPCRGLTWLLGHHVMDHVTVTAWQGHLLALVASSWGWSMVSGMPRSMG